MTLCANNTPSTNEYTGNGAITEYSITFQYYSQSDIFVAFYDTATEAWVSVSNSNWSFLNPTVIKFNTAPADNQRILIYRCTDIDPLPAEFFPGTSIKAADLNNNFFVMKSAIEEINTQAGTSDTLAQSAKATADAANTKADTAIATANTASTNASSAVTTANTADTNATAAVNTANTALSSANTAVSTANTANTTASAANTTANTADTKADTAIATANSASTAAGTAVTNSTTAITTANSADAQASSAVTTANTADTNATAALNAANSATSTANTALSTANTANTTANTANTTANTANTAATAASSDASAAVSSANAAVTTANTADTNATAALNTANSVASVANTADTNATNAVNTANTALSTANTANTTANNANTTANNALSQVSAASPWSESSGVVSLVNSGSTVGVGTSSTSGRKLEVAGHIGVIGGGNLLLQNGARVQYGASDAASIIGQDGSNGYLLFGVGNERARITSSGDFAIGSSSPTARLTVNNSTATGNVNLLDLFAPAANANGLVRIITRNAANTGTTSVDFYKQYQSGFGIHNNDTDPSNFTRFIVGASERMRITSGGNCGINTSTPSFKLDVDSQIRAGATSGYGFLALGKHPSEAYRNWHIASEGNGYLSFFNGNDGSGSKRVTIGSNGNFGIGVSNPSTLLHVAGGNLTLDSGGNNGFSRTVIFRDDVNFGTQVRASDGAYIATTYAVNHNATGALDHKWYTGAASEKLRLTSSGNLGVNTSTPPAKLTVTAGASGTTAYAGRSLNYGALVHTVSGRSGYIVQNTNAFTTANDNAGFQWLYPFNSGGDSNYKVFRSAAGTTLVDKFWVNQGGGAYFANNVGIGTIQPLGKLHVRPADEVNFVVRDESTAVVLSAETNSGRDNNRLMAFEGSYFNFTTSGSEKVRITSSGALGIGESNPGHKLVVRGNAFFGPKNTTDQYQGVSFMNGKDSGAGVTTTFLDFRNNLGVPDTHIFTDHNTDGSSTIILGTTAAGARNTDRRSEKMRILGDGRVGIGVSNPNYKLDVLGSFRFGEISGYAIQQYGHSTTNTNNWHVGSDGAGSFVFYNGVTGSGIEKLRLLSSGYLGVGGIVPQRPLHISSSLNNPVRIQSSAGYSRIEFEASGTTSPANVSIGAQNNDFRIFTGSGTGRLIVKDDGKTGIGVDSPKRRLHLNNAAGDVFTTITSDANGYTGVLFGNQTDDAKGQVIYYNADNSLRFATNATGEKMRILANGNVAIGRSTADHKLDVEGAIRVSQGSNGLGYVQFGDDSNQFDNYHIGVDGAANFRIWNRNIGNGIPMMSIDANANMTVSGNLTVNGTINGASGGGSGGGAYKNVKTDFGAVGNGTTDDTNAVRTALNSGGTIYFPAGTYRITSSLNHTSAFNVVGDGQQSRIMFDASVNDQNLFNLETNVRHNNNKKWSFSSIALSCKAVANRIHASGIRIAYTGAATVIGGTNYLELNDVHIVSEITTDATQAYFRYGLATVNIGGIVADNLNISSFNVNAENNTTTVGIYIVNNLEGHAVIRAFTGNNIYVQRYYKGLHATKAGGGQNIESIYMTQGEIVCNKGIDLAASHATFINGMHIECQRESYINTSDGGPHRVVGCDLRGGRNGTQNLTDYIIKIGVDNCSFTGNYITAQMPSAGCIKTGGSVGNPDNVSIVGNIFNGNGSSTYRALSCESGSANVLFNGNIGSGFGGNSNPVFNQIGTGQGKLNNTTNEFQ